MSSFSRKVRDIRKRAGLTQTEFAAALGVGQSTVSRWESLKYEQIPEMDAVIKIANFAQIDISKLWDFDDTIHRKADEGLTVKVIGEAQTSVWSESARFEDEAIFEVQLPAAKAWKDYSMEGFVLKDDSMNEIYPKNSIVFVMETRIENNIDDIIDGDRVLLVRKHKDGMLEVTVREYARTADGQGWFWPKSTNPLFQEPFSAKSPDTTRDIVSTEVVGIVACAFVFERVAQLLLD